jgi:PAS domain S-box-containing protein
MTAPTRPPRPTPADPDGGAGGIHELLARAVDEAARLLDADGAMVYLVDPATGNLRFAHDAGIRSPRSREWVRGLELAPGTGMFGRALVERAVVITDDYPNDASFRHAAPTDRVVADIGIRSMVVAPLAAGDQVFGAMGTFSTRARAFDQAQIALVRSLADHAAAAMANTRLIEDLDRSRSELAQRAEVERALRQINVRISAAEDLSSVLQLAVDEAARLLGADGARIDLVDARSGLLRWAYASGAVKPDDERRPDDPDETLEQGISGQAVVHRRPFWTGDYTTDERFPHGRGADAYVEEFGIHSVMAAPLVGQGGAIGALSTYSTRLDAWADADAGLLDSIAAQAAIAITRTRLLEELDRSRTALARRAEAEQALREIAARITAMRDPAEILQQVVELASRLVGGQGAILDILDPETGNLRWAFDDGLRRLFTEDERSKLWISVGVGATGMAVAEDRVVVAGDDLAEQFPPAPESTEFYARTGFRSMIAAPITGEAGPLGVIEVYHVVPHAFDEEDAGLIRALAGQAAIAITNARLIDELERSREENAQRADAERTLREIAVRVSSILDPATVLTRIVTESARLLESDGARIDLWDEGMGALRWAYTAGEAMSEVPDWGRTGGLKPRQAVAGTAFAEQRPIMTEDFLADERFETTPEIEAFVRKAGIRAVISAPLTGEGEAPLGVLSVVSRQAGAYTDTELELLTALATHASIAITNANLMEQLARSREDIERRAEAEASLRQITARITALREPDEVLQHVVDEARRLLRADGALIDQYDPESGTLQWAYDAGLEEDQRAAVKMTNLRLGEGVSGKAVAEGRVIHVGDYLSGEFRHDELADSLAERAGVRDLIAAPIIGDAGPLGAIEVLSRRPRAFDDLDAAVLGGLAEQAAIAITNARLIDELERSRLALARRAETERSLRDITARIAALTDPDEVLTRVVEDAKRLLATDGAHLTRMGPTGEYLVPVVVAGAGDDATHEWLLGMEFPLGAGINGLAAQGRVPVWTFDYAADARIPHEPDDQAVADRLGLRGMAAAPLRAPGGEVIGTLAISTAEPRIFEPDDLDLLQGLADQAAIALTNSNLLARLTHEEARFRGLVQTTPDVIWQADRDGYFTFAADSAEALFGWPIEQIVGQHFAFLTEPSSMPVAIEAYAAVGADPGLVERVPLILVRRDGSTFAAEVTTTGVFEDGRWVGAQGTVRDVSERERLERELRESEERYRFLVQNAPDLVWSIGPDARITFLSDAVERLTGFRPDELLGQHFGAIVHASSREVAEIDWTAALRAPSQEVRGRINLQHRDGSAVPAEFIAVATLGADGTFAGANGSVRDMRERDRLERELRASEDRYRTLASSSPDLVFATDAEGRYTFLSDRAETTLGWDRAAALGRPFTEFVAPGFEAAALASYQAVVADPERVHSTRIDFLDGSGRPIQLEINVVGKVEDDRLVGINGVARDVSERERLERELVRSEERYRFLVQNSPDIVFATDVDGAFTFISTAIERLTGYDADELIGQHFGTIVDSDQLQVAGGRWDALVADPDQEVQADIVLRGADGRLTPVDVRAVGVNVGGRFAGIQGAARDVSDKVRLERELRRQAGELAAGEERAHLARELHDSVTQALFSMTLVSRSVEMLLGTDPDAARTHLTQLRELQREALAEMRALIFELRPGNLEQDGLVRAVKTHTAALQGRLGLPVVVESDLEDRLPLAAEEVLYRIAQEALHNVVKHAAARQVRVEIRQLDGGVRLRVEDDGKGFDPDSVPEGHLGLAGMRARADRVGGTFVCESQPGTGTSIEVTLGPATLADLGAAAAAGDAAARAAAPLETPSIRDG